jgi:hypothetical protein
VQVDSTLAEKDLAESPRDVFAGFSYNGNVKASASLLEDDSQSRIPSTVSTVYGASSRDGPNKPNPELALRSSDGHVSTLGSSPKR